MITKTNTMLLGYRLHIDEGVILKPRWWDLPRHLGLRKRELHYAVPSNSVLLSKEHGFMTVRREDFRDLLNDPPNYFVSAPV